MEKQKIFQLKNIGSFFGRIFLPFSNSKLMGYFLNATFGPLSPPIFPPFPTQKYSGIFQFRFLDQFSYLFHLINIGVCFNRGFWTNILTFSNWKILEYFRKSIVGQFCHTIQLKSIEVFLKRDFKTISPPFLTRKYSGIFRTNFPIYSDSKILDFSSAIFGSISPPFSN